MSGRGRVCFYSEYAYPLLRKSAGEFAGGAEAMVVRLAGGLAARGYDVSLVTCDYGQPPQAVVTVPLLVGTDGREKMSKSLGNAIGITEPPEEIYGRVMSISDPLMLAWYDLLAAGGWEDLRAERERLGCGSGDPLRFKRALAARLVARFHGAEAARRAEEHFERVVRGREAPAEIPERRLAVGPSGDRGLLEVLVELGLVASNGEARRLVAQRAVAIGDGIVEDPALRLGPGAHRIRVGKRRFAIVEIR